MNKLYMTSHLKPKYWSLQIIGGLIFSLISLPTYANEGDALLQFSMHVGSIIYVLFLVNLMVNDAKVRILIYVVYLSLTIFAYLFKFNTGIEFNLLLTIFICIITPLVSTIILSIFIAIRRKNNL